MPQRYQKEIQDILAHANQHSRTRRDRVTVALIPRIFGLAKVLFRRPARNVLGNFSFLSPGGLLLLGVSTVILGCIFRLLGILNSLSGLLIWLGVILAILSYVRYFTLPRSSVIRKWRQQVIDDDDLPAGGFWKTLKRFLK